MKKIFLSLILVSMVFFFVKAQQPPLFTIHGHVINQETGAPVSGQSMIISIDSLQNQGHYSTVVTDVSGKYADYVPYMSGIDLETINVYTYDCRGAMIKSTGYFHPGKMEEVINFSICGDSSTRCEAFFKFSPNPNNTLQVAFYDESRYLPGSGKINYVWNFGDSTTSTGQNPIHTYSKPGSYYVCLAINSDDNFCSSTFCLPVEVGSVIPGPCENSFWYYNDSTNNENEYVFNGILINGQADTWKWDFGDGTSATGQTVKHSFYNSDTIYTVCLTTTSAGPGATVCTSISCQNLQAISSPCESSFSYQADSSGSGVAFFGYAKSNMVNSWKWDFGDGSTATGQNVTHSFKTANAAAPHVCLSTTGTGPDGVSCTYNSCQDIYTNIPSPCENYFKALSDDGFVYTFSGAVASGAQANYYWDFGDGTSDSGQVVTHAFGKINIVFNVCLTTVVRVADSMGFNECRSISCQSIYHGIDSSACKAVFSAISDSSDNTYRFQIQSQQDYSYVHWDFGDGSQSFQLNDVHTYSLPGIYTACLTVGDSMANCRDQSCQEIWVDIIQPGCQASFTVKLTDSLNPTTSGYKFFNTSAPGYTSQKWSFGDGTGSTEFNPVHSYLYPGVFMVCLTVWDSLGNCQSTWCSDIYAGNINNMNTVSGVVIAGNKVADHGIVWLVSPTNNFNAETQIDSAGTYNFTGIPYGKFYIYAMLTPGANDFFAYMPTYYQSSLSWQGATLITTGEPNAWYPISLIPSMSWSQGDGIITGTINWGGIIIKAGENPLANVEVVLYNSNGDPVAYTFTNNDGNFEFSGLAYGEYILQAEMPGKATQLIPVSLSDSASTVNINFIVNATEIFVLGLSDFNKAQLLAGNPYPNPVGEILNLKLNASASGSAIVDIIDVQGRIINTQSIALTGGSNLISIATGKLTKGIYMLRVKSEGYKPVQRKFIK